MDAGQARHHAAQRPHLLLGEPGALEQVAHVAHHPGPLLRGLVEAGLVEFAFEMVEEAFEFLLGGGPRVRRAQSRRLDRRQLGRAEPDRGRLPLVPFIADQQHRLRDVERGEGRIDRRADDAVGEHHLVIVEAPALATEQDAEALALANPRPHVGPRQLRRDHRLDHAARPRRRGVDEMEIGDGRAQRVEHLGAGDQRIGARRRRAPWHWASRRAAERS